MTDTYAQTPELTRPVQHTLARQRLVRTYSFSLDGDFEESLWDSHLAQVGNAMERRDTRLALMMGGPL